MTEARLMKLKEMFGCLEHLKDIRKALNDENKPHINVTIAVHDYDMSYDEMLIKGFPDFEEAFKQFIEHYYSELQKAFDAA